MLGPTGLFFNISIQYIGKRYNSSHERQSGPRGKGRADVKNAMRHNQALIRLWLRARCIMGGHIPGSRCMQVDSQLNDRMNTVTTASEQERNGMSEMIRAESADRHAMSA